MFLVACDPEYSTIRHIIITGFAELGRSRESSIEKKKYSKKMQWVKEKAVVAFSKHLKKEP